MQKIVAQIGIRSPLNDSMWQVGDECEVRVLDCRQDEQKAIRWMTSQWRVFYGIF